MTCLDSLASSRGLSPNLTAASALTALLLATLPVSAQYSSLYTFSRTAFLMPGFVATNFDGANPCEGLVSSGSTLYGVAQSGGPAGNGTIFSINTNGTGFSVLHAFTADDGGNSDGAIPNGGLALSSGKLYGTAYMGGKADNGVVFSLTTAGAFSNPYSFSAVNGAGVNNDGASPMAGVIVSGTKLYGTTANGGGYANGVVFSLNTSLNNLTVLHHFTAGNADAFGNLTNIDGANPTAPLVLGGSTLYGTTYYGGTNGVGVIFKVNADGTGFNVLYHFNTNTASPADPAFGALSGPILTLSGSTLYGMSGSNVFAIGTNGAGFAVLHRFGGLVDNGSLGTPQLNTYGTTLYGASPGPGRSAYGQVFSMATSGSSFAVLRSFPPIYYNSGLGLYTNVDGAYPNGGLVSLSGALYGTAAQGGLYGNGVVFGMAQAPLLLSSRLSGNNFILSFPTVASSSYTVLQNTNLASTSWATFTNCVGSGSITQFTKPTAGAPRTFFRLRQP